MPPAAKSKKSEFANLFELFDKLASRRSRARATGADVDDDAEADIPSDLGPVLRNLVSLVGPRDEAQRLVGRARRNTVSVTQSIITAGPHIVETTKADENDFAIGRDEDYRFTFKMMLHKLYELEDWRKKVSDVLEKSKSEFKSLAEVEPKRHTTVPIDRALQLEGGTRNSKPEGRVQFRDTAPNEGHVKLSGRRASTASSRRPRSISTNFGSQKVREHGSPISNSPARPTSPALKGTDTGSLRAIKRRCVGRRKSASALVGGGEEALSVLGAWVYDSAVVSVAHDDRISGNLRSRSSMTFGAHNWNVNEGDTDGKRVTLTRTRIGRSKTISNA